MTSILNELGFNVVVAGNGGTGIYRYITEGDYAVVLLDLMMPEVDSATVLQVLESLINNGNIMCNNNIIVQTAVANYEYLQRLLSYKAVF
ncbi:MAG: response regulator [Deltaproteobacteria bacterium]|nr:response regulator [Deltaproteobacteria bacterium]